MSKSSKKRAARHGRNPNYSGDTEMGKANSKYARKKALKARGVLSATSPFRIGSPPMKSPTIRRADGEEVENPSLRKRTRV